MVNKNNDNKNNKNIGNLVMEILWGGLWKKMVFYLFIVVGEVCFRFWGLNIMFCREFIWIIFLFIKYNCKENDKN